MALGGTKNLSSDNTCGFGTGRDYVIVHELLHFRVPNHGKLWKSLLRAHLGDYVIVHELLHFRVPNHGKLWKSLMRAHLGDYEQ